MSTNQRALPPPDPVITQDRTFLALIAGVGVLRIFMALGMWALAVFISNNPPLEVIAFRLRMVDCLGYNMEALHILSYWNGTRDLYLETLSFSLVVAVLYKIFGAHPLVISVFNSICYACVGLLVYAIAAELGRRRWEARALALAICLWPASLVWSMAPLKEGPFLLGVFGLFFCWMRIFGGRPLSTRKWLIVGLGLLVSIFWLVFLRFYFWYLLTGMLPLVLLFQLLPPGPNRVRPVWKRVLAGSVIFLIGLCLTQPFSQDSIIHFNRAKQQTFLQEKQEHLFVYSLASATHAADNESTPPKQAQNASKVKGATGLLQKLVSHLSYIRRISVRYGGNSLSPEGRQGEDAVDLTKDFQTWPGGLRASLLLVKAGLRDLFLFPYPWEPWPEGKDWGPVQMAVAAQSLLWYLIIPGLAAGVIIGMRRRPAAILTLILWCLFFGLALAVTTLNRGSLFRLREMVIMPLLLLWHPWPYLKLWGLVKKRG
jgi:hypothetical protein